ncbi:hypothetical protein PVAP13_9NG293800 [Panicum virgatum]|uniref:Uncharacterized protein n=1 Tax=Panicum virgatum TaxID=38727 RepID=A0A8T0MQQ9_PANVG|nr:hypothetical protein PVAP13_9NG293800 [Panicum virgatum]
MDGEGGGSGSETGRKGAGKGGESEKGENEAAEFSYDFFADYNGRLTEEEKARGEVIINVTDLVDKKKKKKKVEKTTKK